MNLNTNILRRAVPLFGLLVAVTACSTRKDKFVNRQWQALNTKYNVLYNGNVAYDKGLEDIRQNYSDNYWEILPIERMTVKEGEAQPTEKQLNANFQRAEEKATKAIQKRSMNIGGQERNPQMDEAHLLLGKSRYYDGRFVPALEAFNYILYKYPESDKIYEAKIWRERTNMRLDNDQLAVNNLTKLLKEIKFKDQIYADANATLAQAYLNLEERDSALIRLKRALDYTEIKEEKARYQFILGQLYDEQGEKDSAYTYYQRVIDMKRKSPRRYVIEAHARQARHFDYIKGDTIAFLEKYKELLEDRENRPYLDMLNHQMALYHDARKQYPKAIEFYNKSLNKKTDDDYLTASNYRNLAQIRFNTAKYQDAGQYYDSTLTYLNPRTREFKAIQKKRDNLQDVIKYEGIAQRNDSILNVASLSAADQKGFYEDYIARLRKSDEAKAKKEKEEQERLERENRNPDDDILERADGKQTTTVSKDTPEKAKPGTRPSGGAGVSASSFYFYNQQTVAFGKLEFKKKWGTRTLKPNWRWAALKNTEQDNSAAAADSTTADSDVAERGKDALPPKYDPAFYVSQLPTDKAVLDSLATERNFAYYQLGVIYKEKFKEYRLAAGKLEQLLQNKPEERLVLPSYYHLYKIYEVIDKPKAEAMKERILRDYPDSRYAQILRNPNADLASEQSPEAVYDRLFEIYEAERYRELLPALTMAIDQFTGEEIVPKMELLKARTLGKLKGLEEYKTSLNFTALNYPNSEEGKDAEKLLRRDVPAMEARKFYASRPESWKLLYKVPAEDTPAAQKLTETLKTFTSERTTEKLRLSRDLYTMTEDFVVIHGIPTEQKAKDIATILKEYKEYLVKEEAVVISNENYIIVQMRKNLEEYLKTPPSEPLPDPVYTPEKEKEETKGKLPAKRADKGNAAGKGTTRPPGAPLTPPRDDDKPGNITKPGATKPGTTNSRPQTTPPGGVTRKGSETKKP